MDLKEEKKLIEKAQNGDRESLARLWDSITPKLFGYLINILRDRPLAEDMLQNTWIKAIEALPRFQSQSISISAWIFAIAQNECKQHWRKIKNEIPLDVELHDKGIDDRENLEKKSIVSQALSTLSESDRELIRLRYIADLSLNDIAKILNINFVTVRVRVHRAISRARNALLSKDHE